MDSVRREMRRLEGSGVPGSPELNALLEEAAGGKILGHDLYLYVRQKTSIWGLGMILWQ